MKVRLTDKWIYIIAVINSLLLILLLGPDSEWDTISYVDAWNNSWSKGVMDEFRTPVYPVFIGIMKWIVGNNYLWGIAIFQHIIFLISVFYFRKTLSWIIDSPNVACILTLIYAIYPTISSWANCALTELMAVTGTVFIFYNLIKYHYQRKVANILWITFWILFSLFLRPSSLFLFPGISLYWIVTYKDSKKSSIIGLSGILLICVLEFGYCMEFKDRYGFFAPSSVSTHNQTWTAFEDSLLDTSYTNDIKYKKVIAQYNGKGLPCDAKQMIDSIGLMTAYNTIQLSYKNKQKEWIHKTIIHILNSGEGKLMDAYAIPVLSVRHFVSLSTSILHILLLVYGGIILWYSFRRRKLYILPTVLWITVFSNFYLVILGAGSYGRLLLPSIPLMIIMIGQAFNYMTIKSSKI